ncbi:hypothetical protein XENOCAPTIV_013110 [Xenoophorus captivus]|uniref:Uncharacterized protein n=1 Tax=Xenoophorus captivus TaxID=1517983 RepID=A0ABV0QRJ8_9TELE
MSTVEAGGQCEEGGYGRAAKRPKMEESILEEKEDRAEDELEEGEDSDSGSLPGNGEVETDSRARWSGRQFGSGRKELWGANLRAEADTLVWSEIISWACLVNGFFKDGLKKGMLLDSHQLHRSLCEPDELGLHLDSKRAASPSVRHSRPSGCGGSAVAAGPWCRQT